MTYWKEWAKAAGIRAIRTFAQTAVASLGVATVLEDVNWLAVASASALAALLSMLTSLAGIPEVPEGKNPDVWRDDRADAVAPDDAEDAAGVSRKKSGEDGFRPEG